MAEREGWRRTSISAPIKPVRYRCLETGEVVEGDPAALLRYIALMMWGANAGYSPYTIIIETLDG